MGKRSQKKKRIIRNQQKRLHKLLSSGILYVNMDSQVWKTGRIDGIDIRGHCVGYCLPKGTTVEQENQIIKKWRIRDKRNKLFRIAEVKIELVGTEL